MPSQSKKEASTWFVYFLRCVDNSLYAGITTDVKRRLNEHNTCNKSGAKYTRVRRPVTLVYQEPSVDRKSASQREHQLKKLSKQNKEALVLAYQQQNGTTVHSTP